MKRIMKLSLVVFLSVFIISGCDFLNNNSDSQNQDPICDSNEVLKNGVCVPNSTNDNTDGGTNVVSDKLYIDMSQVDNFGIKRLTDNTIQDVDAVKNAKRSPILKLGIVKLNGGESEEGTDTELVSVDGEGNIETLEYKNESGEVERLDLNPFDIHFAGDFIYIIYSENKIKTMDEIHGISDMYGTNGYYEGIFAYLLNPETGIMTKFYDYKWFGENGKRRLTVDEDLELQHMGQCYIERKYDFDDRVYQFDGDIYQSCRIDAYDYETREYSTFESMFRVYLNDSGEIEFEEYFHWEHDDLYGQYFLDESNGNVLFDSSVWYSIDPSLGLGSHSRDEETIGFSIYKPNGDIVPLDYNDRFIYKWIDESYIVVDREEIDFYKINDDGGFDEIIVTSSFHERYILKKMLHFEPFISLSVPFHKLNSKYTHMFKVWVSHPDPTVGGWYMGTDPSLVIITNDDGSYTVETTDIPWLSEIIIFESKLYGINDNELYIITPDKPKEASKILSKSHVDEILSYELNYDGEIYFVAKDTNGEDISGVIRNDNTVVIDNTFTERFAIILEEDRSKPIIGIEFDELSLEVGKDIYRRPMCAVYDDVDNLECIISGEVLDEVGTYTVYFDATDAVGNAAEQRVLTVTVEDTSAPEIEVFPSVVEFTIGETQLTEDEIINASGVQYFENNPNAVVTTTLDPTELSAILWDTEGVYSVKLIISDGTNQVETNIQISVVEVQQTTIAPTIDTIPNIVTFGLNSTPLTHEELITNSGILFSDGLGTYTATITLNETDFNEITWDVRGVYEVGAIVSNGMLDIETKIIVAVYDDTQFKIDLENMTIHIKLGVELTDLFEYAEVYQDLYELSDMFAGKEMSVDYLDVMFLNISSVGTKTIDVSITEDGVTTTETITIIVEEILS